MTKSHYSAFQSTSLLLTLRSKLITELFVAGCHTNLCVYATVRDAAMYGIRVSLVEDCLGNRIKSRGDRAMKEMRDVLEAGVMSAEEVLGEMGIKAQFSHGSSTNAADLDGRKDDEAILSSDEESRPPPQAEAKVMRPNPVSLSDAPPQAESGMLKPSPIPLSDASLDHGVEEDIALEAESSALEVDSGEESEQEPELPGTFLAKLRGGQRSKITTPPIPMPSYRSSRSNGHRAELIVKNSPANQSRSKDSNHTPQQRVDPADERCTAKPAQGSGQTSSDTRIESRSSLPNSTVFRRTVAPAASSSTSLPQEPSFCDIKAETSTLETVSISGDSSGIDSLIEALRTSAISPITGSGTPIFGPGTDLQSAGSKLVHPFLPESLSTHFFSELNAEIEWQKMHHHDGEVPRLVCCQARVGEDNATNNSEELGSMPVYRHPADHLPPTTRFTPIVDLIRREAEHHVGHPLNHVLIQLYRSGRDNISEHSDKTLDIILGSYIVNVSLGAQRTMRLRAKRGAGGKDASGPDSVPSASPSRTSTSSRSRRRAKSSASLATTPFPNRETLRIPLPHNSLLALSLPTNAKYLHSIKADKRLPAERTSAELAFDGQRISLTFRYIGTWISADEKRIWGTGAKGKTRQDARAVTENESEMRRMLEAFGKENASEGLAWEQGIYGDGFDVLHLRTTTTTPAVMTGAALGDAMSSEANIEEEETAEQTATKK